MEASLDAGTLVYLDLLKRDLAKIVDLVVPKTKEGRLNLMSTRQVGGISVTLGSGAHAYECRYCEVGRRDEC